jgi:hypothetical protein
LGHDRARAARLPPDWSALRLIALRADHASTDHGTDPMSQDHHSDELKVTLSALLNIIRLLGNELVAGRHRDDVELVERAIRTKLNKVSVANVSPEALMAGLAQAHSLISPTLNAMRKAAAEVDKPQEAAPQPAPAAPDPQEPDPATSLPETKSGRLH